MIHKRRVRSWASCHWGGDGRLTCPTCRVPVTVRYVGLAGTPVLQSILVWASPGATGSRRTYSSSFAVLRQNLSLLSFQKFSEKSPCQNSFAKTLSNANTDRWLAPEISPHIRIKLPSALQPQILHTGWHMHDNVRQGKTSK